MNKPKFILKLYILICTDISGFVFCSCFVGLFGFFFFIFVMRKNLGQRGNAFPKPNSNRTSPAPI